MSNTIKLVLYVVLAGLGPVLLALAKVDPSLAPWLLPLSPIIATIGAGLHVDGLASRAKLARLTARLGELRTAGTAGLLSILIMSGAAIASLQSSGCSGVTVPVPPPVVQAGANFAACVIAELTVDELSGMAQNKVVADIIDHCGCTGTSDPTACAAAVNQILDAEAKRTALLSAHNGGR
jgi:hypothetical protein